MIERIDLFHLPFYKKEAFTGSDRGIRFWIGKTELPVERKRKKVKLYCGSFCGRSPLHCNIRQMRKK